VPDIYQGNELWDFSLVDPDNRRSVDYEKRRTVLREVREMHEALGAAACLKQLLGQAEDGRIKLYVTWRTLAHRRSHEALFRDGDYQPLKVEGENSDHLFAFARALNGQAALVIVPRLVGRLADADGSLAPRPERWQDHWIELPQGLQAKKWTNIYTAHRSGPVCLSAGEALPLVELLAMAPLALLQAETGEPPSA
jgi:(1->4)-alpha-D-glucan 1-alpha-D-glucosylmutase